jgi:hypothetical protein
VKGVDEFASVLGEPLRPADTTALEALGALWGVDLPRDFVRFLAAYGDSVISDYLTLYGPRTLGFGGEFFGPGLPDWSAVDNEDSVPILPTAGGLLLCGSTVEGDMLCLKQAEPGRWTVSVSVRNWYEWRDYDLDFTDWFHFALTGQICQDWLPEWEPLPHSMTETGPNPFGVASMGTGPAGASL